MKPFIAALGVLGLLASQALAGPEHIIKQRAKDVSNQNNARQGAPPSHPPRSTPPPAQNPAQAPRPAAAAPSTAAQPAAKLKADIAGLKAKPEATIDQKQQLARNLMSAAQGTSKPLPSALNRLANHLTAALAGKRLTAANENRLAQNLHAMMNCAKIPADQTQAIIEDIQSLLENAGAEKSAADGVTTELKAIAAELQRPAGK